MGLRVNKDQDQDVTECKWLEKEKTVLEISGVVWDTHKHCFGKERGIAIGGHGLNSERGRWKLLFHA